MYIHIVVNQSPELFSSCKTKTLHPSNINSLSSLPHIPATTILHSVTMNAVSLLSHSIFVLQTCISYSLQILITGFFFFLRFPSTLCSYKFLLFHFSSFCFGIHLSHWTVPQISVAPQLTSSYLKVKC